MVSGILWLVEFLFNIFLLSCIASDHLPPKDTCHSFKAHTQIIQQNPPLKFLSQVYEAFVIHDVTYWFHRFGPDAFERCHQPSNR